MTLTKGQRFNMYFKDNSNHPGFNDYRFGNYRIAFLSRSFADQFDYEKSNMAYILDESNTPYKIASVYETNNPSTDQSQESRIKETRIAQNSLNKVLETLSYLDYNEHKHFKTKDYNEVKQSFQNALENDSLQNFDLEKLANPKALARSHKALMSIQAQDADLASIKFESDTTSEQEAPELSD